MDFARNRRLEGTMTASQQGNAMMDIYQLADHLDVDLKKVIYWRKVMKEKGLLDKGTRGIKERFGEHEINLFERVKEYTGQGMLVTEAIRLIKNDITPADAYTFYEKSQRQIEILQRKIVELRKHRQWHERLLDWMKGIFKGLIHLFKRTQRR